MSEVPLYGVVVAEREAEKQCSIHGYLAHKKQPPPLDHHRSLGIGLPLGPTGGGGFL